MRFRFPIQGVVELARHASSCHLHAPTTAQLKDAGLARSGAIAQPSGFYRASDIDTARVPAGLILIKRNGIYLASNGLPALLGKASKRPRLVAAIGFDAFESERFCRLDSSLGWADFDESIPLYWVAQSTQVDDCAPLSIDVTRSSVKLVLPADRRLVVL